MAARYPITQRWLSYIKQYPIFEHLNCCHFIIINHSEFSQNRSLEMKLTQQRDAEFEGFYCILPDFPQPALSAHFPWYHCVLSFVFLCHF